MTDPVNLVPVSSLLSKTLESGPALAEATVVKASTLATWLTGDLREAINANAKLTNELNLKIQSLVGEASFRGAQSEQFRTELMSIETEVRHLSKSLSELKSKVDGIEFKREVFTSEAMTLIRQTITEHTSLYEHFQRSNNESRPASLNKTKKKK